MIQRELKSVTVKSYSSTLDGYGQKQLSTTTSSADMVIHIYSQTELQDPRFVDVELVGLTKASGITVDNVISIDNVNYQVLQVIPGRWNSVLMRKKS